MAPMTRDESIKQEKPLTDHGRIKKEVNRGAWTVEEDRKLAEAIETHGAKKWKTIAAKAGLNRNGKSCRLRWLNYLRPNIKRGNISDQEEDLILRLHKLLGNRLRFRYLTILVKNYWNSHLSKKINRKENQNGVPTVNASKAEKRRGLEKAEQEEMREEDTSNGGQDSSMEFNVDDFFDFSNEDPLTLDWVSRFLEVGDGFCESS
ncbi:hypothetical protein RJ639_036669 [Escallonia herrerae]|uniref:MYB transcription factor n=1 Tax=Escallonia herrerae TaxID=1293975 RepID=A0AA89BGA8_9ASTE|nr:hypothetical protein RJ639_036669 [Escallonia herrerae]